MSSCETLELITLKSSPLVHLLRSLYDKFPGVDCEAIDDIVVSSKCNVEAAEEAINSLVSRHFTFNGSNDTDSLEDWYGNDAKSTVSFPKREIKVYQLDEDVSPKK